MLDYLKQVTKKLFNEYHLDEKAYSELLKEIKKHEKWLEKRYEPNNKYLFEKD